MQYFAEVILYLPLPNNSFNYIVLHIHSRGEFSSFLRILLHIPTVSIANLTCSILSDLLFHRSMYTYIVTFLSKNYPDCTIESSAKNGPLFLVQSYSGNCLDSQCLHGVFSSFLPLNRNLQFE